MWREGIKRLTVEIDIGMWKELSMYCVDKEISKKEVIIEALDKFLDHKINKDGKDKVKG